MVPNKSNLNKFQKWDFNYSRIYLKKFYKILEINTEQRNKRDKKYNNYASRLSHICQFVQNQLLMQIIIYLQDIKTLGIQDSILCFNGIMINKCKYYDDIIVEFIFLCFN